MGTNSGIGWTGNTWNPWKSCRKISPACKFCYMYRDMERWGQDPTKVTRSKSTFNEPLKWKDPTLIFTCSWSDWFIEEADAWRMEAWEIIKKTPHHTYQILTKRPERILKCLPPDWGDGYPNVWIGVSVENQEYADLRIPILLNVPAHVRFLSCEPLLGDINISQSVRLWKFQNSGSFESDYEHLLHWVIIGGESGHGKHPEDKSVKYQYRESKLEWISSITQQCREAGVPVFVKQLGTHLSKEMKLADKTGSDIDEFPDELKFQEFPKRYVNHDNI